MAKIRTFVAVELPNDVRRAIGKLVHRLQPIANRIRWVDQENMHLTLVFLGDVLDREVHTVCRAVARVCQSVEPFLLAVQGVGVFPKPEKPRVLWVGLDIGAEELIVLREHVAKELDSAGFQFDWKFSPHITIGRVAHGHFDDHDVIAKSLESAEKPFGEFVVNEVSVISSTLEKSGPLYVRLSTAPLEG